jgi:hypothetical protein
MTRSNRVQVMRCTNSGSGYDTDDVEWTCKAALPPEFKLGSTDVICEGYSSSDDPYILYVQLQCCEIHVIDISA